MLLNIPFFSLKFLDSTVDFDGPDLHRRKFSQMSAEEEIEEEKMALEAIYGPALSETGCTVELDEFTISWTLPADYPEAPAEFSLSLVEDHDFHEQV